MGIFDSDYSDTTEPPASSPIREFISSGVGKYLLPILTATAGALQRRPGPFGTSRAVGIGGALRGGLSGLGDVINMQDQQAKYDREQRVGKYLTPEFQRMAGPKTVQAPQIETEPGDYPIGTRPVDQPASERDRRLGMLGQALLRGGQSGAAANLLAQHGLPKEEADYELSPGQARFRGKEKIAEMPATVQPKRFIQERAGNVIKYRDPYTLELQSDSTDVGAAPARDISDIERRDKEASIAEKLTRTNRDRSPFGKPQVPTPKDYTPDSIRAWRNTVTPQNPTGDSSVLVPRDRELAARRGSTNEATRAVRQVMNTPGYDKADERGKRQMLKETANEFGLRIIGDVPTKRAGSVSATTTLRIAAWRSRRSSPLRNRQPAEPLRIKTQSSGCVKNI